MSRNLLLVLLVLFGAGAVGGLLFLTGGKEPERTTRAARNVTDGGDPALPGPAKVPHGVQRVTPEMARNRGEFPQVVQPGLRQRFDSPEMIEARERYANRIEELVEGMTDPKLRPDERMAMARELQDLLRKMARARSARSTATPTPRRRS